MQIGEAFRLAFGQIWSQKLKSFFSVLGVVIGVMFLIVVVSVVEGMDRYIREDFASQVFGINTVTVRRTPSVQFGGASEEERRARARRPRISWADLAAIEDRLTIPARVGAEANSNGTVVGDNGREVENVRFSAVTPSMLDILSFEVERGRPFSPQEADRGVPVVILGKSTADVLFEDVDPVGRRVRIGGYSFRVVGVLEEQGSVLGMSLDNRAVAPARSPMQRITNSRSFVNEVVVQTLDPADLSAARMEVEGIMRVQRRLRPTEDNTFEVETADESLTFWDRISRILFVALPGLVSISLVVGGIVIMNIMLVSVMERTREIGVRKALGARRRDILAQVMVESATLSGFGAVIGVGVGVGLGWIVRAVSPLPVVAAPHWIALGVALGVAVGMVAGVYPAARASKLNPVDALRYE
jgi:putative ABC transport system permease protein